jgi:hypothetical protein
MTKIRYTKEYLNEFCIKNKINYNDLIINQWNNRNSIITGKCNTASCNELYTKIFRQLIEGAGPYCINCSKQIQQSKTKLTNLQNLGVTNPMQSQQIRDKTKKTTIEKYGVEHQSQSEEIKKKKRETCLKKYGVNCNLSLKDDKEKIKITNLQKYGTIHASQSTIVQDKMKSTNMRKRGVTNAMKTKEVQNKAIQTNFIRYGVKYPTVLESTKNKCKQTNLIRYGVEYPMQNKECFAKNKSSRFKYKDYSLPSGTIIKVQGYEPFALDILVTLIEEKDIITSRTEVPEIWYYDINGKKHRYYTDIFIKSLNKIIEVKSIWTYKKDKDKIKLTQQSAEDNGYLFECWIFNSSKKRIIIDE